MTEENTKIASATELMDYIHDELSKYGAKDSVMAKKQNELEEFQMVVNAKLAKLLELSREAADTKRAVRIIEALKEINDLAPRKTEHISGVTALKNCATELRKEADGISMPESRVKRLFAADVLDKLAEEIEAALAKTY